MADNELVLDEPRVGWLIDGNPETDLLGAMLRDTGDAIELTIPLLDRAARNPYRRWWSWGVRYGDDPDRTRHSYTPPRVLEFRDHLGSVILVGCRATAANIRSGVGQGRIVANFAVLGASNRDYERLNGLRTEIPALREWTRSSGIVWDTEDDEAGLPRSLNVKASSPPTIRLARSLNLSMRSTWKTATDGGSFTIDEAHVLETSVRRPRPWEDHLRLHAAVLDLVSIAAWRPFGYAQIEVNRTDDPHLDHQGIDHGPRWASVASHRLMRHAAEDRVPRFLFYFSEIGVPGVRRWLRLRREHSMTIGPVLNVLRSDSAWSLANVVQGGIALEALGYGIEVLKNNGRNLNGRGQLAFRTAVDNVLEDLAFDPLDDAEGWKQRACEIHPALKHPNRPDPDILDAINTHRETIVVIRCWIAAALGVPADLIANRLAIDPLASPFSWLD